MHRDEDKTLPRRAHEQLVATTCQGRVLAGRLATFIYLCVKEQSTQPYRD